jgi:hypothetical protein
MQRKQVQFNRQQLAAIRREARRRKISDAAVVRQAVDQLVVAPAEGGRARLSPEIVARALAVVGRFGSGRDDISVEHDGELADILEQ